VKAVILAGGRGSRLAEETTLRPKPLVEIGGRPIIWHIMSIYAHHGIRDFIVCGGYRGYMLKEYFANLALHNSDVTFHLGDGQIDHHGGVPDPWTVTVADTGDATLTAGRVRRVREYLTPGEPFCMTYGDGVGNVDVAATIQFHQSTGRLATMTLVRPTARFGSVELDGDRVVAVSEKHPSRVTPVNGGFFVAEYDVLDLIKDDSSVWETDVLGRLARDGQLSGYRHDGFWQPMDTLWEKKYLDGLLESGAAPWKTW
jgi:glucose-1-phosphate cytidylyltransferase